MKSHAPTHRTRMSEPLAKALLNLLTAPTKPCVRPDAQQSELRCRTPYLRHLSGTDPS